MAGKKMKRTRSLKLFLFCEKANPYLPWDWYIYLHLPKKSTSHVGKCRSFFFVFLGPQGLRIHNLTCGFGYIFRSPNRRSPKTWYQKNRKPPPHLIVYLIFHHISTEPDRTSQSLIHRSMPFNQVFSWACCSLGRPGSFIYESLKSTPRRAARAKKEFTKCNKVLLQYYKVSTIFFFKPNISRMLIIYYYMIYLWFWPIFHTIKTNISLVNFGSRPELTAMTHRQRLQAGKGKCSRTARGLEDHPSAYKSLT